MTSQVLPADADKMSAAQLTATHVPQPEVPMRFARSTMIIGSRGCGKTFLLRHRKQTTHSGAIYISLKKTLSPVAKDTGLGGKALTYAPPLARQVRSKAAAIIAATALELCAKENGGSLDTSLDVMTAILPPDLHTKEPVTSESSRKLRHHISGLELEDWSGVDDGSLFHEVLEEIGASYPHQFALFFDRAEDVPLPAMPLLIGLLDQSFPHLTVIAARPYISRLLSADVQPTLMAGDHYDLLHLGSSPYEDDWQEFMRAAVHTFLDANEIDRPENVSLDWVARLMRDCAREAMSIAQMALATSSPTQLELRQAKLADWRSQRLARTRAALYPAAPNFEAFVRRIQKQCGKALANDPQAEVLVSFAEEEPQLSLLGPIEHKRGLLLDAMQADAVHYPPAASWRPYELPTTMELAPLLAWNGENLRWIS